MLQDLGAFFNTLVLAQDRCVGLTVESFSSSGFSGEVAQSLFLLWWRMLKSHWSSDNLRWRWCWSSGSLRSLRHGLDWWLWFSGSRTFLLLHWWSSRALIFKRHKLLWASGLESTGSSESFLNLSWLSGSPWCNLIRSIFRAFGESLFLSAKIRFNTCACGCDCTLAWLILYTGRNFLFRFFWFVYRIFSLILEWCVTIKRSSRSGCPQWNFFTSFDVNSAFLLTFVFLMNRCGFSWRMLFLHFLVAWRFDRRRFCWMRFINLFHKSGLLNICMKRSLSRLKNRHGLSTIDLLLCLLTSKCGQLVLQLSHLWERHNLLLKLSDLALVMIIRWRNDWLLLNDWLLCVSKRHSLHYTTHWHWCCLIHNWHLHLCWLLWDHLVLNLLLFHLFLLSLIFLPSHSWIGLRKIFMTGFMDNLFLILQWDVRSNSLLKKFISSSLWAVSLNVHLCKFVCYIFIFK